ncbi:hypothetical protein [Pseudomonas viridiflava]|uniref:hypothetical protein n=1 Tax=Pseudomonas viridiflava TaxID=33069 RepID=UPI000F05B70D|nr:hypothetical protein [Pseudomonas viridiflava]
MNFVALDPAGRVQADQLDTFIERWHAGVAGADLTLHDYLGFTSAEYQVWVARPAALDSLLLERTHA